MVWFLGRGPDGVDATGDATPEGTMDSRALFCFRLIADSDEALYSLLAESAMRQFSNCIWDVFSADNGGAGGGC
jgi:hypothetical protein